MNLKELFTKCFMFFSICLLGHVAVSCSDTETTDSGNFTLFFYGVTDIGPSMSCELQAPSYIGGTPYDFAITNVTHEGETYTTESFTVNAETGVINIQNTNTLPTGLYSISVSCFCNGKYYEFKDAVKVNMLLAVPEGVSVTPEEVLLKMDENDWVKASAQVTTEKESHVSIIQYAIAKDPSKEYLEYFTVSPTTGKITIVESFADKIIAGEEYVLDLKLTTKAGEHIYPNAVTFKAISKPRNLSYTPNIVSVEQNTEHTSKEMHIQGSKEEIAFKIKSVTPNTNAFTIDPTTGQISLKANNGLEISDTPYIIDVTVQNIYGETDFPNAYSVNIISFITPIDPNTFKYADAEVYEARELIQEIEKGLIGDEVLFDFAEDNSTEIQKQIEYRKISIDRQKGTITIAGNNTLAPSATPYEVKVKAYNDKNDATTSFKLTVKANPNRFTYIRYGNNLGLPEESNASQYEVANKTALGKLKLMPKTDLNGRKAKWELVVKEIMAGSKPTGALAGTTIDENTGEITFTESGFLTGSMNVGMLVVRATVGEGDIAYSITTPVFIRGNVKKNNVLIKYQPFVFQVNPKTGGRSSIPEIECPDDKLFALDFRKDFNFLSIDIENEKGDLPSTSGSLLNDVWTSCFNSLGVAVNTGAKKPMSYYDTSSGVKNPENLNKLLGYIDPADRSIVINPNMWKSKNNEYANGVLFGRISYITDGNTDKISDGALFYPIVIWFDENF